MISSIIVLNIGIYPISDLTSDEVIITTGQLEEAKKQKREAFRKKAELEAARRLETERLENELAERQREEAEALAIKRAEEELQLKIVATVSHCYTLLHQKFSLE
ncbi:unnamed protein product [Protopolystoma xenopodis]|uniref:Uncharacterized protein n=1 Tax=Protopolystoma xenopodis TaxID=117903 RepID=A0A3S5ADI2_9PLAT|nr:unnamed protein product [Protopolystoma xenopodis]